MATENPTAPNPAIPDWLNQYIQSTNTAITEDDIQRVNSLHSLYSRLTNLSSDEITYRANEIKRLLRNSGFIETGEKRRWRLDPLPFLISQEDWQTLSSGVEQRLRLLSQVLADINNQQQLLTSGVIPAPLLMRHPYYLQECHGELAANSGLFLVAMDIGQDSDGQYYLLNDHCQFPRGLGLLLENRIIARRVMSEEFSECGVERIAGFFQQIQHAVNNATRNLRDPRVVILSRGPEDPYYSEQAYLATYLGYTLVRSADLTVRKGKVWLKALDGLRRVNVILRWIEDRFLDSLEQVDYSEFGVPGLLQAVREKSVILLNPYGAGLIQIPALRNHLPQAAQYFNGEQLILREPQMLTNQQLAPEDRTDYELYSYLDPELKLDGKIHADKINETLQNTPANELFWRRKIKLSQAPFWQRGHLAARPVVLRCYALYFDNQVHILPSALCLTPAKGNINARTAIKDTWIQAMGPHLPSAPVLPKTMRKSADLALLEGLIPSRTAENLFWLGCSLERCEDLVRLLRLFIDRFTELSMYPDNRHQNTLARINAGFTQQSLIHPYQAFNPEADTQASDNNKSLTQQLMSSNQWQGGLFSSLTLIVQSALQVRELLSYDSLRIVENMEAELRRLEKITATTPTHSLQTSLDKVIGLIMAFNGSILDSLSSSNGSFMLEIGRRIERSKQLVAMLTTLLRDELAEAEQQSALDAVLIAQVSSVTHRRRYRMYQSVETGLELLLLDAEYPRSLIYQIEQLAQLCKQLPSKSKPGFISETDKILLQLRASCALSDRETLSAKDEGVRVGLLQLMEIISLHLKNFSETLQTQYFSHTRTTNKLKWSTQNPALIAAPVSQSADNQTATPAITNTDKGE